MKIKGLLVIIIAHATIAKGSIENSAAFAFSSGIYIGKLSLKRKSVVDI